MNRRRLTLLSIFSLALLSACSQEPAKELPTKGTPEKAAKVEREATPDVVIDSESSGSATLIVKSDGEEKAFELNHVIAHRFEFQLAGPPSKVSTWVLLTTKPVDTAAIQKQLDANQNDLMEAKPHFPQAPCVALEIGKDGQLRQFSCFANGKSVVWAGSAVTHYGVEQKLTVNQGRIKGTVKLAPGKHDEVSVDCILNVIHFTK